MNVHRNLWMRLFLALAALEGILPLVFLFRERSMERNAVLAGFSSWRLASGAAMLALILFFAGLFSWSLISPSEFARANRRLDRRLDEKDDLLQVCGALVYLLLSGLLAVIACASKLGEQFGMLLVIYQRTQLFVFWLILLAGELLVLMYLLYRDNFHQAGFFARPRLAHAAWPALVLAGLGALAAFPATIYFELEQFAFYPWFALVVVLLAAGETWLYEKQREQRWYKTVCDSINATAVFCLVFIIYRLTSLYVGQPNTPAKSYFDALADAWLHGQLYLSHPSSTHDLTLYQGNWYVANPPLVAILMVPLVAAFGFDAMNTVVFSIVFGALNASLVFLILERMALRGWLQTRSMDNLWLTALFALGTVHWYLATGGEMWFMSQTVTVTFAALAILLAVSSQPAWLAGAMVALAMIARPNIVMIWPLLLGITIQNIRQAGLQFGWKDFIRWGFSMGIPVVLGAGGLLFYNWLRFANPLDYGYLTENVADFMAGDLKDYGTFHPHFILRNLQVMLLGMPKWSEYCQVYLPSVQGLSIFLATPVLVYLLGSFRRSPWVLGAWASVITLLVPLAMYYNTGAWQFGYKYLLDFILPLILLLALAAGRRMPWLMRLLILASVVINWLGVLWWNGITCRG